MNRKNPYTGLIIHYGKERIPILKYHCYEESLFETAHIGYVLSDNFQYIRTLSGEIFGEFLQIAK